LWTRHSKNNNSTLASATDILKRYWGYDAFRPLQEDVINSVLKGNDTLALMPTGAGKSVCFQVPALAKDGFCLVISPLIALMQDQVKRLKEQDIPAAFLHAGMHRTEVKQALDNMLYGPYKLLYISPERLQTDLFRDYLPEFNINLLAIDEAHCISQWGYDFRPSYLKIAEVREEFPDVPVLALTASATKEVQEDIVNKLGLRKPEILSRSFKRDNIYYEARYSENKNADTLDSIGEYGSSIIYCRSRKQTELVANQLDRAGVSATYYHAGMPKEKRSTSQDDWMNGSRKVIAATTAFGMGIDKPDVRLVLHYDPSDHPEGYYQEAGRAGRDGKPAKALLLYNQTDINRLRDSTAVQYPPEAYLRQVYQAVNEYLQIPIGNQPDRYFPFELADFCMKFKLDSYAASYALKLLSQEGLWTISEAVFHPASIHFITDRHTVDNIVTTYPKLGVMITTLLRMYNTIFNYPTNVSILSIAQRLRMDKTEVEATILQLDKMEVLEYYKPKEGPQLYFHHLRVDNQHLLLDLQRIHTLRQKHIARTEAMIAYMENGTVCREKLLLTYFGENDPGDCGHCDICSKNAKHTIDKKKLRSELLSSIGMGSNIKRVLNIYPDRAQQDVSVVIREMVEERLISWETDGSLTVIGNKQTF
jgi:ATP-dependent DNA helicase RecQ